MNENEKLIFAVGFDDNTGEYKVNIPAGATINEVVFAFAVVTKCLARDGIVDNVAQIVELLNRYLTDPQYDELEEENVEE